MENKIEKETININKCEDLLKVINNESFVLKKGDRNLLRKIFLKNVKRVLCIQKEVNYNIQVKEKEELKMADDIKMYLPIFNGQNYSVWKKRVSTFLRLRECEICIKQKEKRATDTEENWKKLDLKAINYIYGALSDKQFEFVSEEETAFDIIKKLDNMYLQESTAMQICIRNNLDRLRLKDYSESSEFFSAFEKLIIELKNAGATVSEKEKLNYMIRTLPSSMDYIGDLVDVLPDSDKTVDFIKNKIELCERKKQENSRDKFSPGNSSAFKCEKIKDRTCWQCGKTGHYKSQCTRNSGMTSWRGAFNGQRVRGTQQGGDKGSPTTRQYHFRGNYRGRGRGRGGRGNGGCQQQQQSDYSSYDAGVHYSNSDRNQNLSDAFHVETISNFSSYPYWSLGESCVKRNDKQYEMKVYNYNCEVNTCSMNEVEWILDSGCTDHIVNDANHFLEHINLKKPVNVKIGDGKILKATKIGNIVHYFIVNNIKRRVEMKNVFFVENMNKNLISYGKVTSQNKIISEGNISRIINKRNELVAIAYKVNDIYKMRSVIENKTSYVTEHVECQMTQKEKYHRILGHVNFNYLNILCKNKLANGLPNELENEYLKCGTCLQNKMHNIKFKNNRRRAKDILEILHVDLNGKHSESYQGENYFLTIIDDYSKIARAYILKAKNEACECIVAYIRELENLTGKRVTYLRCDNGKEFMNKSLYDFARKKGIRMDPCPPYVHELNGTAERYNRSVMDTARCLLAEAKLNNRFWPEAVKTAVYLKNRTLANTIERKTPYEIMVGEKPNLSNLRLYGSKVFVRVPEVRRRNKWDRKADVGILVGYEKVGYRVLISNKVVIVRHVDIVENDVKLVGYNGDDEISQNIVDNNNEKDNYDEINKSNEMSEDENDSVFDENTQNKQNYCNKKNENPLRRSSRTRKPTDRYNPENYAHYIYVNYVSADSPKSYNEAVNSYDSIHWQEAMDKEIDCITKNKTYKLVERPKDKRIIDLKWVYTRKSENKYKARLVVRGFQQKENVEDIYSPVAKTQTLKMLLSYCVQNNVIIHQMDVECAFLNGLVKSEVYVKQPEGYEDGTNRVCKLQKALYGLRESPRAWYECFDKYLKDLGFKRSEHDYCLYFIHDEDKNKSIYLLMFVDDLLLCCKDYGKLRKIKKLLADKFNMKDMGEIKTYLGIKIEYDCEKGKMTLSQKDYIESLARKYFIENSKLYETPMEQNLKCETAQSASEFENYRNLIGALLYISSGTRPDISYSVNYLSRFQNCSNETHYKYVLRILKYLYLTKEKKLTYTKNENSEILTCMVDADWAGDNVDRKSTTGYIIKIFDNVIYWKSKKQNSVTKSSTSC